MSTGSGGLQIADSQKNPTAFAGVVSGFGGFVHGNHDQFIDLVSVTYSAGLISSSFALFTNSSTLKILSGGITVANITFAGTNYSAGNFQISSGTDGHVIITDPQVVYGGSVTTADVAAAYPQNGIDLPNVAFGARTTLAYAENSADAGGTLTGADGRHAASIALLGHYMAASFVAAAGGHGGTLVTGTPTEQQPLLTHPARG